MLSPGSVLRRPLVACLAVFLLTGAARPPTPAREYPSLDGRYTQGNRIVVFNATTQRDATVRLEDALEIRGSTDRQAQFELKSFGGNAHVCSLTGIAERVGPSLLVFRSDATVNREFDSNGLSDQPCEVHFEFGRRRILLSIPEENLRGCELFCGVRASINGVSFPRKPRR